MIPKNRLGRALASALAATALAGCAGTAREQPSAAQLETQAVEITEDYVIGPRDTLAIVVWREPELSIPRIEVRLDGKISVPLIDDVQAAGRTPLQLKAEMNQRLLERAGSDPAVFELLKSEAQHQMFDVRIAEPPPPAPYMRMVTTLQASFLLLAGGAACLWFGAQVSPDFGEARGFKFFGALGLALGIASLLSAGATFVVARMWNTLNKPA